MQRDAADVGRVKRIARQHDVLLTGGGVGAELGDGRSDLGEVLEKEGRQRLGRRSEEKQESALDA